MADSTSTSPRWSPYVRTCPSRGILDRIGDRWTILVIGTLADGPRRFNEIAQNVDGISQKMLTQTLRALQRDGLVDRTYFPQVPPRVDYALTTLGKSLLDPLRALEEWTIDNAEAVLEARAKHDEEAR